MRQQIIDMIRQFILNRTSFFTREQDIQIALAHFFETSGAFDRVFVEQHIPANFIPNYPWTDANNIYIDLVILKDGVYYPIEIKFKTKRQQIPLSVLGNDELLLLGQQGAQNIGCYDFWKDVKRLELYETCFPQVQQGIMLFVTNDETYLQPPLNPNAGYAQFSIHEGKLVAQGETLDWNGVLSISRNRHPIQWSRTYHLTWSHMQLQNHFFILL